MHERAMRGSAGALLVPMIDWTPFDYAGGFASEAVGDWWRQAMIYIWSGGLWLMNITFQLIDLFTTPDLSSSGPLAAILPITMGIAVAVVAVMSMVQLTLALVRRDGTSLAQTILGLAQFGAVWVGYLTVMSICVVAVAGLTRALLAATMDVTTFAEVPTASSWPRDITDAGVATVLALLTIFLVIPSAIATITVMLTRAAALIVLAAASPITAAGLVSESTKSWFWKANRWFLAALFIPPVTALVLGIGVQVTGANASGAGDSTEASVGTAVVGCILIGLASVCPLVLFRLLAFVDPGTTSGAAFRSALNANGGIGGLLSGGSSSGGSGGSGVASQQGPNGQSQGEADAETANTSRLNQMTGALGAANEKVMGALRGAADQGSDTLNQAGVGDQSMTYGRDPYKADPGSKQPKQPQQPDAASGADQARSDPQGQGPDGDGSAPGGQAPPMPTAPPPPPGGWDGTGPAGPPDDTGGGGSDAAGGGAGAGKPPGGGGPSAGTGGGNAAGGAASDVAVVAV